jgi:glyoxylase-like metal-dependent hydrolase (beta-lactamase superfamily II)
MPYYTDPEPFPGIYRLKLPLAGSPLKYINAYLLPSPQGHLLIDTGWNTEDTRIAVSQQLEEHGFRLEDISLIAITHAHIDHYGLTAWVMRRSGAKLLMHVVEEEMVKSRYRKARRFAEESNILLRTTGIEEKFVPDPNQTAARFARLVEIAVPDHTWKDGDILIHAGFELHVLWTPGHSPGHVCLYDPNHKILFSGDHVLPGITSHIGLGPGSGPSPLDDYTAALERCRPLDVELMLPSHGPPLKGFERRVRQILDHHRQRKNEILDIMAGSRDSWNVFRLVQAMTWRSRIKPAAWQDLRDFDKRLAITEVMAHTESLAYEGRLEKRPRDGIVYYRPK